MFRIYIALGSNLGQPFRQITAALYSLGSMPKTKLIAYSPFYRSKPMGPQNQPDFLNAVAALDTLLSPERLLDHTQAIERYQGRIPGVERWGPRLIDLDIILYANEILDTNRLTVPHYGLKDREFMLRPLADIDPDIVFPNGESLTSCMNYVIKIGMEPWNHQSK